MGQRKGSRAKSQPGRKKRGEAPLVGETGEAAKAAKTGLQGRKKREEAPLVGETGEAVKAAKSRLLEHTQKESSVTRPSRREPEEYARYEEDRAKGAERTRRLEREVKEALEANYQAQAQEKSPAGRRPSGQADLRNFLSPKGTQTQAAARELQEEFAAAAAEGQEGASHGSSA